MSETNTIQNIVTDIKNISTRPSWNEYFMTMSYLISKRSTCSKLQVGCVIIKNNRVISTGYNGHIASTDHISIIRDNHEMATLHAEMNAVCDSSKRGVSILDSIVYVSHFPCLNCTKILIAAGVKEIIYGEDYSNDEIAYTLLKSANVNITKFKF